MRVGIVGFAGSGKSTLFQLLTGTRPDPGKIHAGQVGVATLSDPRLDYLAALHKPKKVTPATVEFLDTPGLLAGSHADNPQRLALIREGDALLIVLNGFAGGDPAAELAAFRDEMLFADLERRHQPRRTAGSQHQEAAARPRAICQRSSRSSRSCRRPSKRARRSPRSGSRPTTRNRSDRSAC